jgi:hypothetical protein
MLNFHTIQRYGMALVFMTNFGAKHSLGKGYRYDSGVIPSRWIRTEDNIDGYSKRKP